MEIQQVYTRRWLALGVLCLSTLVLGFDNTILNVGLPSLVRSLSADASQLQWMVDAYSLVFAGLLLTSGSLGDRYGRKRILILGLLTFVTASILAALSDTPNRLIVMRALMGVGGAMIMPSALGSMLGMFSREERPRAIAILTMMVGLGIPLGPIVGGALIDRYSWHAMFLINVPVVAVTLVGSFLLLPESRSSRDSRLDPLGAVLSVAGLGALLYGIIEGPVHGWSDPTTVAALVAGLLLLGCLLLWEMHTSHPMLPLVLFADPRFGVSSVSITLVYFSLAGGLFFLTQHLQFVLGYSPLGAGIRILPLTLGLAAGAPLGSVLIKRLEPRYVVAGGLAIGTGGLAVLTACTVTNGYTPVAVSLAVLGAGIGMSAAPATDLMMGVVPEDRFGVASAVNDSTQEVGGALGVAVLGSVLTAVYSSQMTVAVRGLPAPLASAARNSVGGAIAVGNQIPGKPGLQLAAAARESFVHAMTGTVLVAAGIGVIGVLVALLFLPSSRPELRSPLEAAEDREIVGVVR